MKKNDLKLYDEQDYQFKICKRQFISDHKLSYQIFLSGVKSKILHLMM